MHAHVLADMLLHITSMRGLITIAVVCACRAGFDELPTEAPAPEPTRSISSDNVFEDGLVLWYELDEVTGKAVLDASGNEHHGKCRTTCPAIVDGYVEEAADFSSSAVIDVPTLALAGSYTMTWWLLLPTTTTTQCMVRERALPMWRVCGTTTGLEFRTGTHALQVAIDIPTTWVHVAVVWDGLSKTIHVNGEVRGSVEAKGTFLSEQLAVGAFRGQVDDLRLYNRALGESEISTLYTELD